VRMVEARLRAANADIEVARARLLPPLDLSAQAGYSALGLASLFQPQNFLMNAIASLAITIFDGGRKEGDKASADINRELMVETYAQTMLQALREVESALSALRTARLRQDAQFATLRASLTMFKATSDAYLAGAAEMGSLLDARRNLQRSQDDWQKARSESLRAYASLAFSLGGDAPPNSLESPKEPAQATADADLPPQLALTSREALRKLGGWGVEIPQLAHRQVLPSIWRDLELRYPDALQGKRLQAVREGAVSDKPQEAESWYRLSLTGFAGQAEAENFCGAMRQGLQACKVARISAPGSAVAD
ncbi:MAG: TolC family protein, partial [Rhodoferax sp.]|nr:TolC family protein [Rhodoferax sp.]